MAVAQCNDEVDELTRMGLQRTAVAMVPTGVDTGQFHPDGEAAPRDQRARILSVGGLAPGHGQDDLIRAMRLVGDAELVIAGGPPPERLDGHAEARRLRELAERAGVAEQVKLVGAVPHDQMATWYRSADVVACTPHYASAGRVSLEAMACGVPVVGYAMGGIADAVVDEVTGSWCRRVTSARSGSRCAGCCPTTPGGSRTGTPPWTGSGAATPGNGPPPRWSASTSG
ncbi:glycosyltransferase [Micromonospora sp. BRA006-A]|nr:glycosyltransferase [Micromonospora sp. BRA006-A]